MKHPPSRHHRGSGSEWLGACFTLAVLLGIYSSMDSFSSYSALYDATGSVEDLQISVSSAYWNPDMLYGFHSVAGDSYTHSGSQHLDIVYVSPDKQSITTADGVRVSFYKDTPIAEIEKSMNPATPRAYSRLANGIAVIEGKLDSASAKTILATIHSR